MNLMSPAHSIPWFSHSPLIPSPSLCSQWQYIPQPYSQVAQQPPTCIMPLCSGLRSQTTLNDQTTLLNVGTQFFPNPDTTSPNYSRPTPSTPYFRNIGLLETLWYWLQTDSFGLEVHNTIDYNHLNEIQQRLMNRKVYSIHATISQKLFQ